MTRATATGMPTIGGIVMMSMIAMAIAMPLSVTPATSSRGDTGGCGSGAWYGFTTGIGSDTPQRTIRLSLRESEIRGGGRLMRFIEC